jgi:hypothetical protein
MTPDSGNAVLRLRLGRSYRQLPVRELLPRSRRLPKSSGHRIYPPWGLDTGTGKSFLNRSTLWTLLF